MCSGPGPNPERGKQFGLPDGIAGMIMTGILLPTAQSLRAKIKSAACSLGAQPPGPCAVLFLPGEWHAQGHSARRDRFWKVKVFHSMQMAATFHTVKFKTPARQSLFTDVGELCLK